MQRPSCGHRKGSNTGQSPATFLSDPMPNAMDALANAITWTATLKQFHWMSEKRQNLFGLKELFRYFTWMCPFVSFLFHWIELLLWKKYLNTGCIFSGWLRKITYMFKCSLCSVSLAFRQYKWFYIDTYCPFRWLHKLQKDSLPTHKKTQNMSHFYQGPIVQLFISRECLQHDKTGCILSVRSHAL